MAETALKKRVAKKQKQEAKTPEAPPSQIRKEAKPKSIFLESLVRQHVERARNMVLMRHIEELQAENKAYKEKEEHRKEQQRKRAAKWRDSHPETHKERERERYRSRNAEN